MPQQFPGIIFDTLTRKSSVTSTLTANEKKKRRKTRENDVQKIKVISPSWYLLTYSSVKTRIEIPSKVPYLSPILTIQRSDWINQIMFEDSVVGANLSKFRLSRP